VTYEFKICFRHLPIWDDSFRVFRVASRSACTYAGAIPVHSATTDSAASIGRALVVLVGPVTGLGSTYRTSCYLVGRNGSWHVLHDGQSTPLAAQPCMVREEKTCGDWQEVLPRHSRCHSKSPAPALPPRPIPAWFSGRCCRCLAHGHRAAVCKDPFRCSRCLENGHHARDVNAATPGVLSARWLVLPCLLCPAMAQSIVMLQIVWI
jgi:hypothetical protein